MSFPKHPARDDKIISSENKNAFSLFINLLDCIPFLNYSEQRGPLCSGVLSEGTL
jgi:hypothetical protein